MEQVPLFHSACMTWSSSRVSFGVVMVRIYYTCNRCYDSSGSASSHRYAVPQVEPAARHAVDNPGAEQERTEVPHSETDQDDRQQCGEDEEQRHPHERVPERVDLPVEM